jgi:hypothetical protein
MTYQRRDERSEEVELVAAQTGGTLPGPQVEGDALQECCVLHAALRASQWVAAGGVVAAVDLLDL